jgi:RNA polymerase sigma-70 factor (ECF subfamily)
MSAGALDMAISRVRQRFGVMLREEVAQTVASAEEVEEELRYLISVFEH